MKIRYGTRGSPLALAQSGALAGRLAALRPGLELERVVIHTSGDRFSLARPAASYAEGGDNLKAMFVKELEEALLTGAIDFAVHSSKDLPAELPAGLSIAAYPEREDPRDVYVGGPGAPRWKDVGPGARVATASPRRQLQLRLAAPGIGFVTMRGNVDTRLRKLAAGEASGLVLAKAGLRRLGLSGLPCEDLATALVVPAPGQGALAVEARDDRPELRAVLATLDHAPTRLAVECERRFLRLVGGGCRSPLGALARPRGGRLTFRWFWSDDAGSAPRRGMFECAADPQSFETMARALAAGLRQRAAAA